MVKKKQKEYLEKRLQEDKQGDSYINYQHVENKNKIELNRKIELETTVNPLKYNLKELETKKTALETTVNPLKYNLKELQPKENSQSAKSTQAKPFSQPENRDEFIGQVFKSLAEKHAQLKDGNNVAEFKDFVEFAGNKIDQIKIGNSNKTNSTLRSSLKDKEFLKSYFDKLEAANTDGSLNKTSSQIGSAAKIPRRSFLSYFSKKYKESSKQDQGKALKTFLSNAEFINSIAAEAKNLNNGTEKINTLKEEINKKEGEISKTQSEINKTQSEINKKDEEIKKKYDQELEKAKTDALGRILLNIELNRLAHDENPDKKDILAASKKIKENADPQKENNDDIYRLREAAAVHYSIYQNVELIEEVSKIITSNEGLQGEFVDSVQKYKFPVGKIIGHIGSIGENIDKLKKLETPDHNQIISNLAIINHSITKIGDQIGKDQKTEFNQNTSIHLLAAATELLKNNPDLKKAGDAKNALLKTVNLAHALGETGKKKEDTWEEVKNGAREAIKVDINNNLKKLEAGFNQPTLESLVKNANKLKQIGEKDEFLSKEVAKSLHELSVNHVRINSYDPNVPDKAKLLVAAVRIEKSLESKQAIPQNVLTDGKITLEIGEGGQRLARIINEAKKNDVPNIKQLIDQTIDLKNSKAKDSKAAYLANYLLDPKAQDELKNTKIQVDNRQLNLVEYAHYKKVPKVVFQALVQGIEFGSIPRDKMDNLLTEVSKEKTSFSYSSFFSSKQKEKIDLYQKVLQENKIRDEKVLQENKTRDEKVLSERTNNMRKSLTSAGNVAPSSLSNQSSKKTTRQELSR